MYRGRPGGTSRLAPGRDTLRLIQQIIESRSIQKLPIQHHGRDLMDMMDVEGRVGGQDHECTRPDRASQRATS